MSGFNKLFYTTLSGEKKLNAVTVHITKEVLAASGIDIDANLKITGKNKKIIIEENKL